MGKMMHQRNGSAKWPAQWEAEHEAALRSSWAPNGGRPISLIDVVVAWAAMALVVGGSALTFLTSL